MSSGIRLNLLHDSVADRVVIPLLASWCLVSVAFLYRYGSQNFINLNFVNQIPVWTFLAAVFLTYLALLSTGLNRKTAGAPAAILLAGLSIYAAILLRANGEPAFFTGIMAISLTVGFFVLSGDRLGLSHLTIREPVARGLVFAMSGLFVLFVGGLTVLRYRNFVSSTYDFGIFSQMFYYLKETLQPLTTCERNGLLSHFAVHISPVFYLLLPGFILFPNPMYLNVMQSLILASGVIPLRRLAQEMKLSTKASLGICLLYLAYPALAGGAFYDIHENKFLTPLLLWLFLYIIRKQNWGIVAMALLTLMVKEDAALYVCCIGLYMMVSRKQAKTGGLLMALSLCWFAVALYLLRRFGQGAMTDRYSNFISDPQLGLASVLQTIFLNPGYAFKEMFSADKLKFILQMLLPLWFLPLFSRKAKQLFLLIPFVVMNLLSNYPYQHSIYFQYTYGSIAIFFYLAVVNLREMTPRLRQNALALAIMATLIIGISHLGGFIGLGFDAVHNQDDYRKIRDELARIPATATVQATRYYLPALSQRLVLYDVNENRKAAAPHETEYVVLDLRPGWEDDVGQTLQFFLDRGYVEVVYEPKLISVLQWRPDEQTSD